MPGSAPDVSAGLAGESVIDGADQNGGTKGQQQMKDTAAQIIEIPASLTEEAMKGTKVLELGQIAGLNDAGEGAASGAQDPRTSHGPEGTEAGLGEARLEGEQEWSKGMDQEIGHQGSSSFT